VRKSGSTRICRIPARDPPVRQTTPRRSAVRSADLQRLLSKVPGLLTLELPLVVRLNTTRKRCGCWGCGARRARPLPLARSRGESFARTTCGTRGFTGPLGKAGCGAGVVKGCA
jgi:hypothetical protein